MYDTMGHQESKHVDDLTVRGTVAGGQVDHGLQGYAPLR